MGRGLPTRMQSPPLRSLLLLCLVASTSAQLASLKPIGASQALDVSVSDDTVAPVLPNGWTFLGETAKWIAVSNDRVEAIAYDDAGVHVTVRGAAGERVDLAFLAPGATRATHLACTIPLYATTFSVPAMSCA